MPCHTALVSPPFARELRFALDLVAGCGARALEARRAAGPSIAAEHKPDDGSPVTAVDRELDARIVAALRAAFPGDAILAEESGGDLEERLRRDRCWMIDPIDGTSDFVRGSSNWAIHVGLVVEGAP
jgi:fructose-1,6-bisphosphatase/inositol monophosphatase family enzyme